MIVNSIPFLAVSFLAGIVCMQLQAELPSLLWSGVLLPAIAVAIAYKKLLWFPVFLAGFFWAAVFGYSYINSVPDDSIAGQNILITGVVSDLPKISSKSIRFQFHIEKFELAGYSGNIPEYIRLSWYYPKDEIQPGQRWQFLVRLKPPNGFQNPGGFDYEAWLYQQGIHATGYVKKSNSNQQHQGLGLSSALNRLRYSIQQQIQASANAEEAALLNALAIGYRGDISLVSWQTFIKTGTNHLIAISGLHIGLVAGFSWILLRLMSRLQAVGRTLNQRKILIISFFVALMYAALAGFTIPTQRALIMLAVVYFGVFLNRQITVSQTLAIALIAVLLYSPTSVLSAGFWLSFLAVAVISYSLRGRLPGRPRVILWLWPQFVVIIALIPVGFYFFQQSSLIALAANIIAIPVVSVLLLPILLLSVLLQFISSSLSAFGLAISADILSYLLVILKYLSEFEFSVWVHAQPELVSMLFAMMGLALLFSPYGLPARWLSVILFLPLLTSKVTPVLQNEFELHVLDVGQGLSVFIRTQNHHLLFDTGAKFSPHFDAGERVVMPFLRRMGVSQIDELIISNGDRDHIGGAVSILNNFKVGRIRGQDIAELEHANKISCSRGQGWQWDGVIFEILHPQHTNYSKRNNYSCVLRVSTEGGSVLIAADIEKQAEAELSAYYADALRSEVLIVPHHGSKTSSTTRFLSHVEPDIAIYSSGYLNRYRFPKPEIVNRLHSVGARQLNTAKAGHVWLSFDQSGLKQGPVLHRQQHRRYWHRSGNVD